MSLLADLHGTLAILLLAALLYAEESGVPLPVVPGDVLLISAGLLIANDAISPWVFLPVAFVAVLGGALTGYTWTRLLGSRGLWTLAERIRATAVLERAADRLRSAGPLGIGVSRFIPGLRVYSTLVAGAVGIDLRVFLLGATPAIVLWIILCTLVGYLVGVPAIHLLTHVQKLALDGVLLVLLGGVAYLGLRHIPAGERRDHPLMRAPGLPRVALALVIDGAIVAGVVSGVIELARDVVGVGDPKGIVDMAAVFVAMALFYTAAARGGAGATAGERLLAITYRPWHDTGAASGESGEVDPTCEPHGNGTVSVRD